MKALILGYFGLIFVKWQEVAKHHPSFFVTGWSGLTVSGSNIYVVHLVFLWCLGAHACFAAFVRTLNSKRSSHMRTFGQVESKILVLLKCTMPTDGETNMLDGKLL